MQAAASQTTSKKQHPIDPVGVSMIAELAGRLMLFWGWRRALAAFGSGALGSFAQAPYDFFAIGFLSFPLLVWLLDGASVDGGRPVRRLLPAFATGWWFGFGYFLGGLWWVGNAMLVDIRAYAWALPIAVLLLPAAMAVFYGLAAALARLMWSEGIGRIAALAAAFALTEWLRGMVLTGFPWNAIGYAAMPVPMLMQSVTLVGMLGMNALAVFVFSLPAAFSTDRGRGLALALLVLIPALHAGFGYMRLAGAETEDDGGSLIVRLVQPSILQNEKWDRDRRDEIFATYLELTERPPETGGAAPQLILWPETALPFLLSDRPDALTALGEVVDEGQRLLAGAVRLEGESSFAPDARFYNSVIAIDEAGVQYDAADKIHLVPLGEFVPFEDWLSRIGITKLVQMPGGFTAGSRRNPIDIGNDLKATAYICYEVIFPGIAAGQRDDVDLLVNVTNDAWFGRSPGPYQHFRQAQVRAVEAGLPLVRAANNGLSGAVDSYGRVIDALELDGVGVLDVAVPLKKAEPPLPLAPIYGGLLIVVAMFLWSGLCSVTRRKHVN